jgi:hypothetical protein
VKTGYGRAENRVMNEAGNVAETISNDAERPLV